jgi:hypothetical protein
MPILLHEVVACMDPMIWDRLHALPAAAALPFPNPATVPLGFYGATWPSWPPSHLAMECQLVYNADKDSTNA